jgi:putative ABC transport system ATP-binding protein
MTAGDLLREVLRNQRRTVAAGAASGVLWMAALAAVPFVISRAVDDGVVRGDRGRLAVWLLVLAGLAVAQVAGGGARHWLACRLHYGTTAEVSRRVTARVLHPGGPLDDHPGALVSLVTSDAARVGAIADLCCRGTGAVVAIGGVAAMMVAISPVLAGAVLAAIPLLLAVSFPLLRPLERRATTEQRARAAAATAAADLITGHRVLHGLGAMGVARQRFAVLNDDVRTGALATARVQANLDGLAVALPGTLLAISVAVGSGLVADGSLTVGQLVAFLASSQFLLTPVATLVEVGDVWTRGLASAGRVVDVLDRPQAVADGVATSFEAGADAPALAVDGWDVAVGWGEVVAVTTASAGTARALAELLARQRDPEAGRIALGGVDVRTLALPVLHRTLLVAHGDGLLLDATVRQNVAFGRGADDSGAEDRAMAVAAVDEVVERLPMGVDALVGERGRWLSGGQRQRIGLARALAADAPVLVLVDPTSAVDAQTERVVTDRLVELRRRPDRATLLVTSSPVLLAAADRVVDLDRHPSPAGARP